MEKYKKYEMVGWIAARGGSKRLPRKNVKMLLGKPMIAYGIEALVGSKYVSRTFVSTEDKEIKEISLKSRHIPMEHRQFMHLAE